MNRSRIASCMLTAFLYLAAVFIIPLPAFAQAPNQYTSQQLVAKGHEFFGTVAGGLAGVIEEAVSRYGQPNGYVLGEEGSAAIIGGLRYGEGHLHTQGNSRRKVYWQGPSVGWDFGGDGARTMMLVYNMRSTEDIHKRFVGVAGSAYLVGGFGMTVLNNHDIYVVPIKAGVGARLGVNVGYLKFTPSATWNPF
ncbi:DUF1134 domain-containing protein [Coralliovum pocilloporae]|uniref:DUF1134 domain-containing protein n=1 Tax=Coralliovum pocilloporae TaxID=3066369 RepID=UPI003307A71E